MCFVRRSPVAGRILLPCTFAPPRDARPPPPPHPRAQVKREFYANDVVYNSFLDIMKNFKAQT